jgi:methyl-accepting chemotaxis protein
MGGKIMKVNNLKVKTNVLILSTFLLSVAVLMGVISVINQEKVLRANIKTLESSIKQDYDNNIKNQVQNVISLLNGINDKCNAGEYTLEEAKKISADLLRGLTYGDGGYFWADTYEGDNIVLLGKDAEGANRMKAVDVNGYPYMENIIANGRKEGGGFTEYWFPKTGETKALPKRSYSIAFEPFGWVIGTGKFKQKM